MKNNKRSLKGMTLIEVLVALAVFAMLSGILLGYGAYVDKTERATRYLKNKVVEEAPYASARQPYYYDKDGNQVDIAPYEETDVTISFDGVSGHYYPLKKVTDSEGNETYTYSSTKQEYKNPSITMKAKVYSTKDAYDYYIDEYKGYTGDNADSRKGIRAKDESGKGTRVDIDFIDDNNYSDLTYSYEN